MNLIKKSGIVLLTIIAVLQFSNCRKNDAPTCRIISPQSESAFDYNEVINVEVSATDKDGNISYVELYIDDVGAYSLNTFPYNFKVVAANFALSPGSHTITAIAKDDRGEQSSHTINVNINPKETTVPDFISFQDGRIPSVWYPTEWEVDNNVWQDDDHFSIRAPQSNMAIATQKTGSATINSVEFWLKGSGQVLFYIDGTRAKSCDLSTEWRKHTVFFGEGQHTFKWEFTGESVNMDAILFKYTQKPAVGDYWEGGIVVKFDGHHGFIAAPTDQSDGIMWSADNKATTTNTGYGTGAANTQKIVAILGEGLYAAKLCNDLVLNGYDDWYLPSNDELRELLQMKATIGGFQANSRYWTSSVAPDGYGIERYAYWINFTTGTNSMDSKQYTYKVRAVRSF